MHGESGIICAYHMVRCTANPNPAPLITFRLFANVKSLYLINRGMMKQKLQRSSYKNMDMTK